MHRSSLPRVVIDLERLKRPYCGLGQFALHFGQAIVEELDGSFLPTLLLPPAHSGHFSGDYDELTARPWMKLSSFRSCRALLPTPVHHHGVSVWHATHQGTKYWPTEQTVPVVLTVHDLNFLREKTPAKIQRRLRHLQRNVDRSALIVTGSKFAAAEIREHLDLQGKRLQVVYNGATEIKCIGKQPALPLDQFLFTIGEINPKKNFQVLVNLMQQLPEYQLVIAGKRETKAGKELVKAINAAKLADRIFVPGKVSDEHREWLYQHCSAFVFPSIAEGFGLPVVEAMRRGRPVFAARRTSLPEIGGPLGFYWDDFDAPEMAEVFRAGMRIFAADATYSFQLQQHAKQFRWQKTARDYLSIYRDVWANQFDHRAVA